MIGESRHQASQSDGVGTGEQESARRDERALQSHLVAEKQRGSRPRGARTRDGNWVRVHGRGRTYAMRMTMDRISHRSARDDNFVRVRRSVILNVRAISTFERYGKGTFAVRLRDGATVISSRFSDSTHTVQERR